MGVWGPCFLREGRILHERTPSFVSRAIFRWLPCKTEPYRGKSLSQVHLGHEVSARCHAHCSFEPGKVPMFTDFRSSRLVHVLASVVFVLAGLGINEPRASAQCAAGWLPSDGFP